MTDFTGFTVPRREGAFYVFDIGYLEGRLRALRDEHGHVWRRHFTPEGRVESLARLPRF